MPGSQAERDDIENLHPDRGRRRVDGRGENGVRQCKALHYTPDNMYWYREYVKYDINSLMPRATNIKVERSDKYYGPLA